MQFLNQFLYFQTLTSCFTQVFLYGLSIVVTDSLFFFRKFQLLVGSPFVKLPGIRVGGGVVWICLLWVAISGSETKCIYNSFTNELDVFWMYSKDIRNWISLSSYDESSDIISFIFWHTLTCSDLFLGGEISARQWQRKGAVNPSKVFFGGKMAQSRNISRRKKTLNLPDFNHS